MKKKTAVMVLLLAALAGGAALIAGGGSTPVADVATAEPAQTLVVAQDQPANPLVLTREKPALPLVVTQDQPIVYCCGGGPATTSVGATAEPAETLVSAQDKKPVIGEKPKDKEVRPIPCPHPVHFTVTASSGNSTPNALDFGGTPLSRPFGGTTINQTFGHTFDLSKQFPSDKDVCCQCVSGTLTLKVKALQAGSKKGADAGNDTWGIYCNKKNPQGGKIYANPPFEKGHTETVTIHLNAAALCCICQNHRLSFGVQDDTSVISATLEVTACCVTTKCREQPTPDKKPIDTKKIPR